MRFGSRLIGPRRLVEAMQIFERGSQVHFRITVVDTSKKDAREVVSDARVSVRDGVYLTKSLVELALKVTRERPDVAFLTPVGDHSLLREAAFLRLLKLCGVPSVCQFHARYEGELFVTGRPWARRFLGPLLAPCALCASRPISMIASMCRRAASEPCPSS